MSVLTAANAKKDLRKFADKKQAVFAQKFFRTEKGGYGEGDIFLGLNVPQVRSVAKFHREMPLKEVALLLQSPFHEDRLCALVILSERHKRGDSSERAKIYKLYLKLRKHINNWDLVDVSAAWVVGGELFDKSREPLFKLAKAKALWERRIAIVSTHYFIRKGDVKDALKLAEILRNEPEDLMHKAVGWTLREIGKRDQKALERFLDRFAATLPRTALRYSLERFPPKTREHYMGLARKGN